MDRKKKREKMAANGTIVDGTIVQSTENLQLWTMTTQLWAAVARSDAEIALQRTKILKLEAELQLMKGHRDGNVPQLDATARLQAGSKRGRCKKALRDSLEITVSLPDSDPTAMHAPGKRARTSPTKVDIPTTMNTGMQEKEVEEKDKPVFNMSELVYRPSMTDDHDQKSCSLSVNSLRNETTLQKHSIRQTLEYQNTTNNSLLVAKDGLAYGHINHFNGPFKPNNVMLGRKDSNLGQSTKDSTAASFLKTAASLDYQGAIPGDLSYGVAINGGDLCPEANGNFMAKDDHVRSQLQAHFNSHDMENPVSHDLQKTWEYAGEDGSDEQDEGCASVQDDDDVDDDDDENVLDDMHSEKVSNLWHSIPFR